MKPTYVEGHADLQKKNFFWCQANTFNFINLLTLTW